jgi:Double zinc ribbon/AMP-binding enzyme C-terminal domain
MRCPHCAFENRAGICFCEECGRGLERVCPACGAAVPPGRKFCGGCGQPLSSDQAAARAPTPDTYTPKHLAEKILRGLRGVEAYALRLLAELAAHADPPETEAAHARYAEALRLATELGMRPLVAHCHLGFCKLYRRAGDEVRAPQHLTTAATMYRTMGMEEEHPRVRGSCVIGLPDEDLGNVVHAILQVDGDGEVGDTELLTHLRDRLAPYKLPRSFERVSEPLRDEAGKVRRPALRAARVGAVTGGKAARMPIGSRPT